MLPQTRARHAHDSNLFETPHAGLCPGGMSPWTSPFFREAVGDFENLLASVQTSFGLFFSV